MYDDVTNVYDDVTYVYDDVTIDDTQKLKSYWVKKGGIFVHHTNTKNTLKQLQKLGIIDNHKSQNQDDN